MRYLGDSNTFVYYYFLGRKRGAKPSNSACWAFKFCTWWIWKQAGGSSYPAPKLEI